MTAEPRAGVRLAEPLHVLDVQRDVVLDVVEVMLPPVLDHRPRAGD
ncbi:MAG: hypothetical protein GYB51_20315 [Rhodobacteraceae bacterium]|nr:hypothetical protein [Paracoccaceae bacterium]